MHANGRLIAPAYEISIRSGLPSFKPFWTGNASPIFWKRWTQATVLVAQTHLGQTLGAGSVAPLKGLVLPVAVREHFLLQGRSLLDDFFQGYVIRLTRLLLATFLSESCADLLDQALILLKLKFQLIQQSLGYGHDVSETAPRLRISFEPSPRQVASPSNDTPLLRPSISTGIICMQCMKSAEQAPY